MGGGDLSRVAVLIIACPAPWDWGNARRNYGRRQRGRRTGILNRDVVALEKTGRITSVLFDKTGTLTHGKMGIADSEDFLEPDEQAPRVP